MSINIRDMEETDAFSIAKLEKECFSDPWPEEIFLHELRENMSAKYIVVEKNDEIIGYGGIWFVSKSGYITNIAVSKKNRNKGVGTKILDVLTEECLKLDMELIILEVRESNIVAQELYGKLGFVSIDIKEKYYTDNNEDAIIMGKSI